MRQAAKPPAAIAMIAAWASSFWPATSRADFFELPRAFDDDLERISCDMPRFAPIESFVDWLEAAYGGPLGGDKSIRHARA